MADEKTGTQKEQTVAVQKKKNGDVLTWPEEVDRLFDRANWGFGLFPRMPFRRNIFSVEPRFQEWTPNVDILEKNGDVLVKADLPGMKREDIEVVVEGDMLVIKGHRKEEKEIKEENYYRSERSVGEFYRSFGLPEGTDANAIEASYKDGVLEVKIPRPTTSKAEQTKVQVK